MPIAIGRVPKSGSAKRSQRNDQLMISRIQSYWSVLTTFRKLMLASWPAGSVRIEADPKHFRGPRYAAMLRCWVGSGRPSRALRRAAVAAFSFLVRARNLCVAHPLCMQRRNREAGSRLQRPRGVMPERLFLWQSARPHLNQILANYQWQPGLADEACDQAAVQGTYD